MSRECLGDGSLPHFYDKLGKTELLVIDDWGLSPINPEEGRDFLDIIDDRHGQSSTIMISQLPVEHWHELMSDPLWPTLF